MLKVFLKLLQHKDIYSQFKKGCPFGRSQTLNSMCVSKYDGSLLILGLERANFAL
jgi:hypothetical protein